MKKMLSFFFLAVLAVPALADQVGYGQCGGIGWTGSTTCVSGFVCTVANPYYSQCLPGGTTDPNQGEDEASSDGAATAHCYDSSTYACDVDDDAGVGVTCTFTGRYGDPKSCTSVGCGILGVISSSTRHCVLKKS